MLHKNDITSMVVLQRCLGQTYQIITKQYLYKENKHVQKGFEIHKMLQLSKLITCKLIFVIFNALNQTYLFCSRKKCKIVDKTSNNTHVYAKSQKVCCSS